MKLCISYMQPTSKKAKKYYIGQTRGIAKRIVEHNSHVLGGYTSRFPGKWELIYKESIATRSEAIRRERQLKSFRGREFIKTYIPG